MGKLDVSRATVEQKSEILRLAADVRKFEIERFWARSIFFWGFIGAAFITYGTLYGRQDNELLFIISCFGIASSVAWTLLNRGGKYWQEAWETKVEVVETDVLGARLFSNPEPLQRKGIWGAARFSVSKLTIALSDFTILVWLVLSIKAAPARVLCGANWYGAATIIATAIFILLLFMFGRSSPRNNT